MVVLVTHREDLTADWLVAELRRRNTTSFLRLNTEDYPTRIALSFTLTEARLRVGARDVHADEVEAVWWRRPLGPQLPESPPLEATWAADEAQTAIEGFWRAVDGHWVNSPLANASADCKPEQLRRATALGFDVPEFVITNDVATAQSFGATHGQVVCKALRDGNVPEGEIRGAFHTELVRSDDMTAFGDYSAEPYLFQAFVPKKYDIRVTVIGDEAFACRIASQDDPAGVVDWRKGDITAMEHTAYALPAAITALCVQLTQSYNLRFAAIDLCRRVDGGYTFFELNPNGQWAWIEQLTGLPLSAALADELIHNQ